MKFSRLCFHPTTVHDLIIVHFVRWTPSRLANKRGDIRHFPEKCVSRNDQYAPLDAPLFLKLPKFCNDCMFVQDYSTRSECPSSPTQYRIGSKRRHPEHRTCPCKRPILDFSKMCEVSRQQILIYFSLL